MTRSERWMAARWAVLALVVGGLSMSAVAVAGLRALEGAYIADQRERSALVRSEGSWTPPTDDPNIHYQEATLVGPDGRPVVRRG